MDMLQTTPAYKKQVKPNPTAFEAAYATIRQKAKGNITSFQCFELIHQLLGHIQDRHFQVYGKVKKYSWEELQDSAQLAAFQQSPVSKLYPSVNLDLDSLERELAQKPLNAVAGIYHYKTYAKIGVYELEGGVYQGVILDCIFPTWQRGEVYLKLYRETNDRFSVIHGHLIHKQLFRYWEKIALGRFYAQPLAKQGAPSQHAMLQPYEETYTLQEIDPSTQYLKLGSFGSADNIMKLSRQFFNRIKTEINKPNLIVDVRNNGGGADKNSMKYVKFIQKYAKKNRVYVLTNFRTISNAEHFTIKLKGKPNITLLGETTSGTLSYGSNLGTEYPTPSGLFFVYPTDMDFTKYISYEGKGITPDILLDPNKDWVEQVLERIGE